MPDDNKSKKPDDNSDDELVLRLGNDDSALVVRTNGQIELVSKDLREHSESYVGDIDELNRTFTLVLAFAAALDNESLYHDIFQNLNHVLHKQWNKLSPEEQARIKEVREREGKSGKMNDKEEWLNRWRDEIERGRQSLEDYMNKDPNDREGFTDLPNPDAMETRKKPKRKKGNPLTKLKGVKWDPNDVSLTAHFKEFRADESPDEED